MPTLDMASAINELAVQNVLRRFTEPPIPPERAEAIERAVLGVLGVRPSILHELWDDERSCTRMDQTHAMANLICVAFGTPCRYVP